MRRHDPIIDPDRRSEPAEARPEGGGLLTFTPCTGVDPEVSLFANDPIARNVDVAPFAPSRSSWLSFAVTS